MRFLPKTLDECINRIDCKECRAGAFNQSMGNCQLMRELALSERIANDDYLEYNPSTKRAYHYRAVNQIKKWCIPFICERCGSCVSVEIHHIDRDVTNNNINNLEVLCRCCHEKEHRGEDREY